jgi:hypothetical protein
MFAKSPIVDMLEVTRPYRKREMRAIGTMTPANHRRNITILPCVVSKKLFRALLYMSWYDAMK